MTSDILYKPAQRNVVQIKALQRASQHLDVVPADPEHGLYLVESASRPDRSYAVVLADATLQGSCTCPWSQYGGINCKHVLAALRTRYAEQGSLSFWRTRRDARRQHRRILTGNQVYATLRPRRR